MVNGQLPYVTAMRLRQLRGILADQLDDARRQIQKDGSEFPQRVVDGLADAIDDIDLALECHEVARACA